MNMRHARPRVAHVVLDLHEGGLERLVVDLVIGMREKGFDSRVLCLSRRGQLADELSADEVEVVPPRRGIAGMLLPRTLSEALGQFGADIVHGHSGTFFKTMRAGRMARVPVVLTDHGRPYPDPVSARFLDSLAGKFARRTIAVSLPLSEYLARTIRIPRSRLAVIQNGVRFLLPPLSRDVEIARARVLSDNAVLIGSVGRLDRVKAYDVLIRAVTELRGRSLDVPLPHLVLVGDGPDRARLEHLIAELGASAYVTLAGWISDIRPILSAMDVFVLSSDSEGTSISLLEAMQAGRAIVATNVGGTPDVLGPELKSQLVSPQNPIDMSHALERLCGSPELRERVGMMARRRVVSAYSQSGMLAHYDATYRELIGDF